MPVFIYGLFCPVAQTIRYVGKSTKPERRLRGHLSGARRGRYDHHTARWLRSLEAAGTQPSLVILHECDPVERWQDVERRLIAEAGERGWKLTNSTAGGEGLDFLDPADDRRYREKLSRSQRMVWARPEMRAAAAARSRAIANDPAVLARRNEAIRRAYDNPEVRGRVSQASRETASRAEVKKAKSEKTKAAWQRREYREAIIAARNDPDFTAAQGDRLRKRWADPTAREKMNGARWTPEKRREQAMRIAAINARRKEQANG